MQKKPCSQHSMLSPRRAFTLVEILVVIGILIFLVAITLPVVANLRTSALRAGSISNMRQVFTALTAFTGDNNANLPIGYQQSFPAMGRAFTTWQAELATGGYLGDPDIAASGPNQRLEERFSVLGSPLQRKFNPAPSRRGNYGTFSANWEVLRGNFLNPELNPPSKAISFLEPSRTMLLCEGSTHGAADSTFNSIIYPAWQQSYPNYVSARLVPQPDDKVVCLFIDGHVETRRYGNFPLTTGAVGSDSWFFWLGR